MSTKSFFTFIFLIAVIIIISEITSYVMGKYLESKGVFYKPSFEKDYDK